MAMPAMNSLREISMKGLPAKKAATTRAAARSSRRSSGVATIGRPSALRARSAASAMGAASVTPEYLALAVSPAAAPASAKRPSVGRSSARATRSSVPAIPSSRSASISAQCASRTGPKLTAMKSAASRPAPLGPSRSPSRHVTGTVKAPSNADSQRPMRTRSAG
jgi:hypothetical protein